MTGGDKGLQGITRGYLGLQRVTRGYRGLQGVTRGYRGLQRILETFSNYIAEKSKLNKSQIFDEND